MANVQLAKNLKTLRKKYNYTQQDVSTFLNMPIYKYRHSETVDHIHTLYLTDQEVNLIENFRDASENDRQMLLIFLNRKP